VHTAVGQFVRKSWEQLLPAVLQSAFSVFWVGLSDQLLLFLLGALSLERGVPPLFGY
jgi:uncharacterized membrane protein YbhN (UPF0104 family)